MSRHYKEIKNGKGTSLLISDDSYITVGPKETDIMLRGSGKVFAFDHWNDFIASIDPNKAVYFHEDVTVN